MKNKFKQVLYLLPLSIILFFYFKNGNRFGHLLLTPPVYLLFFVHILSAYLVFVTLNFIFKRNRPFALLITSLFTIFFFLFGAIQDFLFESQWMFFNFLSNTLIICILFLLFVGFLMWRIRNKIPLLFKINRFFLLLFLIFLFSELIYGLIYKTMKQDKLTSQPLVHFQTTLVEKDSLPDIYHFLFDSYASDEILKQHWQYDNPLLKQLDSLGFFTFKNTYSNYSLTALSLSSMFNMNYLEGTKKERIHSFDNFLLWSLNLKKNSWFSLLETNNYNVQFHSLIQEPFSSKSKGNMVHESPAIWLRMQTFEKAILDPWRLNRIKKIIGTAEKNPSAIVKKYYGMQQYNLKIAEQVGIDLEKKLTTPAYNFYHFLLPHYPYLFDTTGRPLPINASTLSLNPKGYLNQVKFSNILIDSLVKKVMAYNPGKPKIIIVSGDHGFKDFKSSSNDVTPYQTICAIYFTDKGYENLSEEMSLVNLYRHISNKAFKQQLPLLRDSIILGE